MYSGPKGCYRSDRSWGKLFSDSLNDCLLVRFISRACSVGIINDYYNKKKVSTAEVCHTPRQDEIVVKSDPLDLLCEIYVQPQSQSVTSDVNMVLLTIGGNDLGFIKVIETCFIISSSGKIVAVVGGGLCRNTVNNAKKLIDDGTYQWRLLDLLVDVGERMSPQGSLILSSYPHILTDTTYVFGESLLGKDKYDAGTAIRTLANKLDNVQCATIKSANKAHAKLPPGQKRPNIYYFDKTKDMFNTHKPDPSDKVNPTRWIAEPFDSLMPYDGINFYEWYHPLPVGQIKWAEALSQWSDSVVAKLYDHISKTEDGITGANIIDLAFVIDATASMSNNIAFVKNVMTIIVSQILTTFQSYRVAIVTYKDSGLGAGFGDYASLVNLNFNNLLNETMQGVNAISVPGRGDDPETVLLGLNAALDLDWRPGVTKIAILMGDAPPKIVGGKEPASGLTDAQIIMKSEALDPVQIMAIDLGGLYTQAMKNIVDNTGGMLESTPGGLIVAIRRILENASRQPFAWFGESMVVRIGYPLLFDARGSYDPQREKITSYEWDFDGNGVYDELTNISPVVHTYNQTFDGFVSVRVTSVGGQGFVSAHVIAKVDGSISQAGGTYCIINETSSLPILKDENGAHLGCLFNINSVLWQNRSLFNITVADNNVSNDQCLEALQSTVVSTQSCEFQEDIQVVSRQIKISDYIGACTSMEKVVEVIGVTGKACLEMCEAFLGPQNSTSLSKPTREPSLSPTLSPTKKPTMTPRLSPTKKPTLSPTLSPTKN